MRQRFNACEGWRFVECWQLINLLSIFIGDWLEWLKPWSVQFIFLPLLVTLLSCCLWWTLVQVFDILAFILLTRFCLFVKKIFHPSFSIFFAPIIIRKKSNYFFYTFTRIWNEFDCWLLIVDWSMHDQVILENNQRPLIYACIFSSW